MGFQIGHQLFENRSYPFRMGALTLTNSRISVKSENQKTSEGYENYIFRIYGENEIYGYKICDFSIRIRFIMNY